MSDKNDRKSHVERFYEDQENKEGAWIDIEMFDRLVFTRDTNEKWVKTSHIFMELKEDRDERQYHITEVRNPDDEEQFVEVPVWTKYSQRGYPDKNTAYTTNRHYDNTDINQARKVDVRKIVKRDVDDSFLDDDKQPPREPEDYLNAIRDTNSTDTDQYVNFEVIHKYKMGRGAGPSYQATSFNVEVANSQLLPPEDQSQPDTDATAVRFDVLQNIVNVSWEDALAVEFGDKADGPPKRKKPAV